MSAPNSDTLSVILDHEPGRRTRSTFLDERIPLSNVAHWREFRREYAALMGERGTGHRPVPSWDVSEPRVVSLADRVRKNRRVQEEPAAWVPLIPVVAREVEDGETAVGDATQALAVDVNQLPTALSFSGQFLPVAMGLAEDDPSEETDEAREAGFSPEELGKVSRDTGLSEKEVAKLAIDRKLGPDDLVALAEGFGDHTTDVVDLMGLRGDLEPWSLLHSREHGVSVLDPRVRDVLEYRHDVSLDELVWLTEQLDAYFECRSLAILARDEGLELLMTRSDVTPSSFADMVEIMAVGGSGDGATLDMLDHASTDLHAGCNQGAPDITDEADEGFEVAGSWFTADMFDSRREIQMNRPGTMRGDVNGLLKELRGLPGDDVYRRLQVAWRTRWMLAATPRHGRQGLQRLVERDMPRIVLRPREVEPAPCEFVV